MSQQDSDEPQVTFHDVPAYFSKEEWTLLHEWQKELYRNVMKEIHQALISLGPLIATTVFSLRAKEKQELYPMDNTDSERRHNINNYSSDTITNPDVLFGINREEHLRLNIPQDAEGRERIDCLSTGFPFSNTSFRNTDICLRKEEPSVIFIDHLGTEVGESCPNPSLADPIVTAVFSLSTNNEEETHFKEEPVGRTTADPVVTSVFTLRLNNVEETHFMEESVGRSARNGAMNRKQKEEHFVKSPERSTPCIASLGNTQTLVLQNSERQTQSRSQLWAGSNQEPEGEATSFSNPAHSSLQKGIVKLGGSGKDNECESNPKNTKLLTSQKNTKHYWGHTCNEYGTNFNEKGMFVRHQRTHTGKRRYQCTECEKSFSQKADVVRHQRTHTGEKPYHCSECEKSFSQKADLCRHQRTHTGDRPYKCTVCEKSFSQKGNLIAHKRTHTGERPYKCTVCMKNFSRKLSLTVHQRTHIITQFRDTSPERDLQLI